jgi:hypothetical protein
MSAEQTPQTEAIAKVTRTKLAVRERQRQALELRLAGDTYQSIADTLACSKHRAHSLVQAALDAVVQEPAEKVRLMELERLDRLYAAASPSAERGDPVMIAACLRIQERRARLLGLDAPEPVQTNTDSIAVVDVAIDGSRV